MTELFTYQCFYCHVICIFRSLTFLTHLLIPATNNTKNKCLRNQSEVLPLLHCRLHLGQQQSACRPTTNRQVATLPAPVEGKKRSLLFCCRTTNEIKRKNGIAFTSLFTERRSKLTSNREQSPGAGQGQSRDTTLRYSPSTARMTFLAGPQYSAPHTRQTRIAE